MQLGLQCPHQPQRQFLELLGILTDTTMFQGLTAQAWWESARFPWMAMLEANADVIRGELSNLAQLTDVGNRSAHDVALVTRGGWSEHVLLSASDSTVNVVHRTNRCPRTTELLLRIPALVACAACGVGEAIFSVLAPKTHLRPHCASSNLRLTCHLPLIVPPGSCTLRVGSETRAWTAGKSLVFDDSFEHEARLPAAWRLSSSRCFVRSLSIACCSQAFNDADEPRVVLLLNFFHPDLPQTEWQPLRV